MGYPQMHRLAKWRQKVEIRLRESHPNYPNGTVGIVEDILFGTCGPILAIRIEGYGVVDLFWKKVRPLK